MGIDAERGRLIFTYNVSLLAALVTRFGLSLHRAITRNMALKAAYKEIIYT
jgi:hypothetical protein